MQLNSINYSTPWPTNSCMLSFRNLRNNPGDARICIPLSRSVSLNNRRSSSVCSSSNLHCANIWRAALFHRIILPVPSLNKLFAGISINCTKLSSSHEIKRVILHIKKLLRAAAAIFMLPILFQIGIIQFLSLSFDAIKHSLIFRKFYNYYGGLSNPP